MPDNGAPDGATVTSEPALGVSISGGGVRATLFSLGVVLYLCHSDLRRRVRLITSVSGGSITSAVFASSGDFADIARADFERITGRSAQALAKEGAFLLPKLSRDRNKAVFWISYIALTIGYAFVASKAIDLGPGIFGVLAGLVAVLGFFLVPPIIIFGSIFLVRGSMQRKTYRRLLTEVRPLDQSKLAHNEKAKQQLADLPKSRVLHVFCATELNSGRPVYIARNWIYSPAYGSGRQNLCLSDAVYASAAFPVAFPPLRVAVPPLEMSGGDVAEDRPANLLLADGGIFNNLATDWYDDVVKASSALLGKDSRFQMPKDRVKEFIVINASAPARAERLPDTWPERNLKALRRVTSILYENTLSPRLLALGDERRTEENVTILDISTRPLHLAKQLSKSTDDDVAGRARGLVTVLEDGRVDRYFEGLVERTSTMRTTLGAIGPADTIRLLRRGYISAAVACHAKFGTAGLDEVPDENWFRELIESGAQEASTAGSVGSVDAPQTAEDAQHGSV
jgi:predicted acylesterase/phospholipase RssA